MARKSYARRSRRELTEDAQLVQLHGILQMTKPHISATSNGKGSFLFKFSGRTTQAPEELPVLSADPDDYGDLVPDSVAAFGREQVVRLGKLNLL